MGDLGQTGPFAALVAAHLRLLGLAVGDFDGNGLPDVAVANSASSSISILLNNGDGTFRAAPPVATGGDANRVAVLLGNGNGTFGDPAFYPVPGPVRQVIVGNFGGDGHPDIAVASAGDGPSVSVLRNQGLGTFDGALSYNGVARV